MELYRLLGGGMYAPDQPIAFPEQPHELLPAQEFYSIKQVAAITGVSARHIRRAVVGGVLVASDLGTKEHPLYRVSRGNILKWMKDRENGAIPPTKKSSPLPPSKHHKPKKSAV